MKLLLLFALLALILLSCQPVPAPGAMPTLTDAASPFSSTPGADPLPAATATQIQLPFDPDLQSDEYCKPPYAVLPVADGNDISEDEIVTKLMKIWLRRYATPEAPLFCRIGGYTIDEVYSDARLYDKPLEPRGDFMRMVKFSVKLDQVPNAWMSFAGDIDQDNWMHVTHPVAISKTGEGYKLEFAYP